MASSDGRIEALEHRLMRAWAANDRKDIRQLLARRFRMVVGAATPVLLDRRSFAEAAGVRWKVNAFRFGSALYTREVDGVGLFAAEVELEGRIEGVDVSGRWWMADIWRKSALARRWQLLDRQLSRPDSREEVLAGIRSLQLWRQ
jgi:hypothetical protein